jgi:transcriptional regulator with XRE-family HTH domain
LNSRFLALIENTILSKEGAMYRIEILEKKRLEKGLSYTEIADRLGMHKVTVSRTLKGVTMKPRTVKTLADYLGVEMERIVQ